MAQSLSHAGSAVRKPDPYRGATIEDLDPPPALSCNPQQSVASALMAALERDYTHLTVISQENRALLGYLSIPKLQSQLDEGKVGPSDPVESTMIRFRRKVATYRVITKDTPLIELQAFFDGEVEHRKEDGVAVENTPVTPTTPGPEGPQEFAIVTDPNRRFVMGVATRADLEEFLKRRPA